MQLVVDASTLVAEVLRARGRQLLAHPELDLVVAAEAMSETEHELRKRVALLVERGHLEAAHSLFKVRILARQLFLVLAPELSRS